jgi:AraC-like DNA-binding protein
MVSIVRARYATSLIDVALASGASIDHLLHDAELDERILETPEGFISVWQLGRVFLNGAIRTDNIDIGWDAAQSKMLDSYGSFSKKLFSSDTLLGRLNEFCAQAPNEYSEASFSVYKGKDKIYFKRGPIRANEIEARQTELYVLSMMLGTAQGVLGRKWVPEHISLQTFYHPGMERLLDAKKTDIRFDQPETVIIINQADSIDSIEQVVERDASDYAHDHSQGLVCSLEKLIQSHISSHRLSLNLMAKICDLHPRTLQRCLADHETSFRELVARQRFVAAVQLLKDRGIPIAEVSHALGYANQAHFSRAFRAQAGLSPLSFRQGAQAKQS